RGLHKINDMVVYCEVDSVLPESPEFEFLRPRNFRIKTVKLRGQISQGIVFPLSILEGRKYNTDTRENSTYTFILGDDVTELLGITKYEPLMPACLSGLVKGNFPSFIPKTDEERIQNIPYILDTFRGHQFYLSEKLDGTSMTCYYNGHEFGVCSRNLDLKETEGNIHWKVARQLELQRILGSYNDNLAIQGELIGEGIQGNKYKLRGHEFRIFNIFNISTGKFAEYEEILQFIQNNKLQSVPMLGSNFILNHNIDELLSMADGSSMINMGTLREGLVVRAIPEAYHIPLGRVSFKVISNKYLLKQG
ncbi:MAG: RNA ligase (ATP), partial [Ignavibacteria bacterium]|nr:RNA ligase (ATP) [Ignavibacteria bacterium]